MPASELRSTMPSALIPSKAAAENNSSGDDAPRRNEKCVVTWRSASSCIAHAMEPPPTALFGGRVTKQPVARSVRGFDTVVVADQIRFGLTDPPLAMNALGA